MFDFFLACLSPQSQCLGNIATDLAHYSAVLESYLEQRFDQNPERIRKDNETLRPTIGIIDELRCLLSSQVA